MFPPAQKGKTTDVRPSDIFTPMFDQSPEPSRSGAPESTLLKKSRVLNIVALVVVVVAVGIVVTRAWQLKRPPEWQRANPALWASLGSNNQFVAFINTRTVIRAKTGAVISIMKASFRSDTDEGREEKQRRISGVLQRAFSKLISGEHFVYVFHCDDAEQSRTTALEISHLFVDSRDEPLDGGGSTLVIGPGGGYAASSFAPISAGSWLEAHRQAACWLANSSARQDHETLLPAFYRELFSDNPRLLENDFGPLFQSLGPNEKVGDIAVANGSRVDVFWQPATRVWREDGVVDAIAYGGHRAEAGLNYN